MEVEFYIKFGVEWNGGRIGNRLKRVEMDEETELEIFRLDGEFLLFWWGGSGIFFREVEVIDLVVDEEGIVEIECRLFTPTFLTTSGFIASLST